MLGLVGVFFGSCSCRSNKIYSCVSVVVFWYVMIELPSRGSWCIPVFFPAFASRAQIKRPKILLFLSPSCCILPPMTKLRPPTCVCGKRGRAECSCACSGGGGVVDPYPPREQRTPLMAAALRGLPGLCEDLLTRGAAVGRTDGGSQGLPGAPDNEFLALTVNTGLQFESKGRGMGCSNATR